MWEHEPDQKLKRKLFDKEEGKTHTLFYEKIRALSWVQLTQTFSFGGGLWSIAYLSKITGRL